MDEIVSSVQRLTDIMGEIASASAEQVVGVFKMHATAQAGADWEQFQAGC